MKNRNNISKLLYIQKMWSYGLIASFMTIVSIAYSQTVQHYGFSQSQETYNELLNPTNIVVATNSSLENTRYPLNLPFDFPFNNTNYNSFHVHSSGFVSFGTVAPFGGSPINNSFTTFDGAISALGAVMTGRYNAANNIAASISYETIGTAPNREFVIQWKDFEYYSSYASSTNFFNLNIQIRLHENGEIKFVYDLSATGNPSSFSTQVGLRGTTITDYTNRYAQGNIATSTLENSARGGANSSSVYIYKDYLPTSGLTFNWTPPSPCVAPTTQPTDFVFTKNGIITTVDFTATNVDRYLVLRTPEGVIHNLPQDGTNYPKGLGTNNVNLNAHVSHITETTNFVENATNSGILGNTAYTYTAYAVNSSCLNGPLYNVTLPLTESVTTCPAPINTINLASVNANSFEINWVPNNGNALPLSYILEVATDNGFTNQITGSPFTFTTTDNTYQLTQLNSSTTYYYRIKTSTSCGESVVSSVKNVTTACLPVTDLDENFQGATTLPACWSSIIRNIGSSTVTVTGTGGVGGTNGINLYANTNPNNANADLILVTPYLSNINGSGYRLKFDAKKGSAADIKLAIGTLDNNSTAAIFTQKGAEIELTTNFETYYVYFSDYTGTDSYIGFNRTGTSTYTNLFIDNVVWELSPACAEVSGLTASDFTINSAKISWSGAGTLYDVEFGVNGFTPTGTPSTNMEGITTNYVINSLTESTTYQFYVRQNCNATGDGAGSWAGPFTFTTATKGHIGSTGTATSNSFPIESNYNYNYSQQIYLTNELQAVLEPGETLITKIRFKQLSLGANPERYNNWKVFLNNTDSTTFATSSNWIAVDHTTPSFDGDITFAANTWFDINLNTPFQWDGTSNLLVTVHEIVEGFSNSSFAAFNAPGANRGILYRNDNNVPTLNPMQSAITRSSNIAQIQIVAEVPTSTIDSVIVNVENDLTPEITTVNGTLQLEATVYPASTNQDVTWTIESGAAFASIDQSGIVTGLSNGIVIVRATSDEDNSKYDEISITVAIIATDYCNVTVEYDVEPITLVDFADLNNPTSAVINGTPSYEDFTSMIANIERGETYIMTVKGNTGNFEHDIRVFIDWNQDLEFDMNTEFYTASLQASTGEDDEEVTINITVPTNAILGNTRMRITKDSWNVYEEGEFNACTDAYYGQIEDYTVNISEPIEITSVTVTTANNVTPEITTENGTLQLEATVNPTEANQNVTWSISSGNTVVSIDQTGLVTALLNGTAIVRATSVEDNTKYDEISITVNVSYLGLEKLENNVSVYPNPTSDFIQIETSETISQIIILDLTGKEIITVTESNKIDVRNLPTGTYLLQITLVNNRTITEKVIKK